ncbi:MAG: TonB-dependent receptor [Nitrospinae bacterium]|nr:TonB-dependent receptor [Nitrospinota bacterium]MBL7020435.1 TonB-dependent receptor [Nitrospinaceae bacterium]
MRSIFSALAFILLLLTTTPTQAEEEPIENLQPIEVSVSRFNTSEDNYPGSVEIITAEEIKQSGHQQVVDILREQLGIDMTQNGPRGTNSTIILRGSETDGTLVLIDGVQVNSNTTGAFDFGSLNLDNVERIEILRGPQSTIWGADASAGVINIVTKKGKGKPTHAVTFELGSFDTFYESLSSSGKLNDLDYSFSASRTDSKGFSALNERFTTTRTDDGFQNTTLSSKLGMDFAGDGRVELVGRYSDSAVQIDDFQADSPVRESNTESLQVSMPIKKGITDWWDLKFTPSMSYQVVKDERTTKTDRIYSRNYTLDMQNNMHFGDFYNLVFGMEYEVLNGNNVLSNFKRDIYNQGYFLQANYDYKNRVLLTGGFRKDINSQFKDPLTYKFEAAYKIHETGTRFHVAHATGFRAPSFNQLFFPNFGNPNLKPEESKSSEAGIRQNFMDDRLTLSTTYFYVEYKDFIDNTAATNISTAKDQGIESQLKLKLPYNAAILINHTWQNAVNGNGAELSRRAKHNFSVNLSQKYSNGFSGLIGIRGRNRIRTNSSGSEVAQGFVTLRTALSLQYNKSLRFNLRAENILDKKYEEVFGFSTQGASAFLGATYSFN